MRTAYAFMCAGVLCVRCSILCVRYDILCAADWFYLKFARFKGVPIHTPSPPKYSLFCPSIKNCTLSIVPNSVAVYTTCIS